VEPRKNVLRLIKAFEQIADRNKNLSLILAGKPGWNCENDFSAIQSSVHRDKIRYLGFVSECEKTALLKSCEVLAYPSLYEGFGLPVLEAMAAGAPVITSNLSSLPEVAGDAAILVNPLSVEEISTAIDRLVNDKLRRAELRAAGKRRAAEFTWQNVAMKTYQLYMEVVKAESST
jgi:glycosyltransferase involved in cell wall biosynthesis